MSTHVLSGHVNSTEFHGKQAPCASCEGNPSGLDGIPDECQWDLLQPFLTALKPGKQGRFKAWKAWARMMGIVGIRVKPPPCVFAAVEERFGASTTGFVAGDNPCGSDTCGQARDQN